MRKFIGMAVANWLRKPENQDKVKRTAKRLWHKHQSRKQTTSRHDHTPPR
ncbi:hypothetical protein [Modicisalibacter xianhensis]|uniref:Uncharacterized protein n=1 Tax=Modicisalibacter xianhensis TaxID=442341 RepID=A0A1I2Y9Q5_9GAMM|nr:hypothetical protein [Halomonas xianhensis]TDX33018.1 hypothetical protein DFO67_101315 [Halomonas xianhensis]SFH22372.1 hypothetical protein SAMN04487959_101311 [Halomonas xianhensis]